MTGKPHSTPLARMRELIELPGPADDYSYAELDRETALLGALELIQQERDELVEQLEAANRERLEWKRERSLLLAVKNVCRRLERERNLLQGDLHRTKEQFDALDDAIRDALDFLPEPPEHPNGATHEQKASWFLSEALRKHGAQLSNPAKRPT